MAKQECGPACNNAGLFYCKIFFVRQIFYEEDWTKFVKRLLLNWRTPYQFFAQTRERNHGLFLRRNGNDVHEIFRHQTSVHGAARGYQAQSPTRDVQLQER
jgi:hypothetical protein